MWMKCFLIVSCLLQSSVFINCHDVREPKVTKREPQFIVSSENHTRPSGKPRFLNKYQPNWQSLDSRPLPQWYDDAKVGE